MTEADLDDLDSLLTLLAGAPLERLSYLAHAARAYDTEAGSDVGIADALVSKAQTLLDRCATTRRNAGHHEVAARMFGVNLNTLEGVRAAMRMDVNPPTLVELVNLYAVLTRDQHEQIAASLEEINKSIPQIVRASS